MIASLTPDLAESLFWWLARLATGRLLGVSPRRYGANVLIRTEDPLVGGTDSDDVKQRPNCFSM